MINYFYMRKILILLWVVLSFFLFSCKGKSALFICDAVYGQTVVEPYQIQKSLKAALKEFSASYKYIETPLNVVLDEYLPESVDVVILSPFLGKQGESVAASRPDTLFVVLEQPINTPLKNFFSIKRQGNEAYRELGQLFGILSKQRIPSPFMDEDEEVMQQQVSTSQESEVTSENSSLEEIDEEIAQEWEPSEEDKNSIILTTAVVTPHFSQEREQWSRSFIDGFAQVNDQSTMDLLIIETPENRDTAALNQITGDLRARGANLVFIDAGVLTPQIIEYLNSDEVIVVAHQVPREDKSYWKNVDLVLEWNYDKGLREFFKNRKAEGNSEIFFELEIKNYKRDSILYPYYAEEIIDK